jgi:hypothetical protein
MSNTPSSHKSDFFIAIYFFCLVSAELLGAKTFPIVNIFGYQLNGAVGMLLIPFIYSINDIFFEVYGRKRAKNLARTSIIIVALLTVFVLIAVSLPSTKRFAPLESSYNTIFTQSIRISIASLIALGSSNLFDVLIFAKLKERYKTVGLWFRNNLSNITALFIDTVIFMTFAFYSFDQSFTENFSFLFGLILPYWLLKSLVSAFGTPIVYWGVKWLRKD